jgi:hypothetical protein
MTIENAKSKAPRPEQHKWTFKARFRRDAFGWRSRPAIQRVREAVFEIKKVARGEVATAAEGAVTFLEKVSPALQHVDSSSGAIGTAVNRAIEVLVPIIARAPVDGVVRSVWLERLRDALAEDNVPYIETLSGYWGELCASKELASVWADRITDGARMELGGSEGMHVDYCGTNACLSALLAAERYGEIIDLVDTDSFWPYRRWVVKALAALGNHARAIEYAEGCRTPWATDQEIDGVCEGILLSCGKAEEAYHRYGLIANRRATYLAWFRGVAKKYPHKQPSDILTDLVAQTPGNEGKWFAAAKSAKLFDRAIALANRTPCDPGTLTRAARDFADENPAFAVEAGMAALRWLVRGEYYETTTADILSACRSTIGAAQNAGRRDEICDRVRGLIKDQGQQGDPVAKIITRELLS